MYSRAGIKLLKQTAKLVSFPNGNKMTVKAFGDLVKKRRKELGMNQAELALVACTGVRFISDLENGKATCELGKALEVMSNLGVELAFVPKNEG